MSECAVGRSLLGGSVVVYGCRHVRRTGWLPCQALQLDIGARERSRSARRQVATGSVFIVATWIGLVPGWLTAAAVARDVMIGLGAMAFHLLVRSAARATRRIISKVNTLCSSLICWGDDPCRIPLSAPTRSCCRPSPSLPHRHRALRRGLHSDVHAARLVAHLPRHA